MPVRRSMWAWFLLAATACGGDSPAPGVDAGASLVTIQELNQGAVPPGTRVTVRGVISTFWNWEANLLYVQEPEGGPHSGIVVNTRDEPVSSLHPSENPEVDIENAVFMEADGRRFLDCAASTEQCASDFSVSRVSDGFYPQPEVLVPWELAGDATEADRWINVLIRFDNVRISSRPTYIEKASGGDWGSWESVSVAITGPLAWELADVIWDLSPPPDERLPATFDFPSCFRWAAGIFEHAATTSPAQIPIAYRVFARGWSGDVGTGAASCLPTESTAVECDDGADNDHSGFIDCADRGCDAPTGNQTLCDRPTTVADIASGTFDPASGRAALGQVTVTAISAGVTTHYTDLGSGFFVQDTDAGGAYNGLYVPANPGNLAPGDTVDLRGRVTTLTEGRLSPVRTELSYSSAGTVVPGGSAPDAAVVTIAGAQLAASRAVLVRVENVSVTQVELDRFSVSDGVSTLWVQDDLSGGISSAVAVSDCVMITGVMSPNQRAPVLLPRGTADIAMSTGCQGL